MDIVRDFERLRIDEPDYLNIDYYEGRKEMNLDDMERWLSPVLAYDIS